MAIFPFPFKSPQTEMRGVSLFQKMGRRKSKVMHNKTNKMPLQRLASMLTRGFNHGTENPLAPYEYLFYRLCSLMLTRYLYLSLCYRSLFLSLFFKTHSNHQDNRKLYSLVHMICLILFSNLPV